MFAPNQFKCTAFLSAGFLLFAATVANAAVTSIAVTSDTFIQTDGGSGNDIYGAIGASTIDSLWNYHNGGSWVATPLFYFDLSAYSGHSVTADGSFSLQVAAVAGNSQRNLTLVSLTTGFNPQTATYNNTNASVNGASISALQTIPLAGGSINFTIPAATLQSWIDSPATNYGFALVAGVPTPDIYYHSSEAGAALAPTLTLTTIPEPGAALLGGLGLFVLLGSRRRSN